MVFITLAPPAGRNAANGCLDEVPMAVRDPPAPSGVRLCACDQLLRSLTVSGLLLPVRARPVSIDCAWCSSLARMGWPSPRQGCSQSARDGAAAAPARTGPARHGLAVAAIEDGWVPSRRPSPDQPGHLPWGYAASIYDAVWMFLISAYF